MSICDASERVQLGVDEPPWSPPLPICWPCRKAKYILRRMKRPHRPTDGIVTAFRDGQVTLRENRRAEGFTNSLKEIGYQGVRKGDLVVHAMDAFAGAIGVSDADGKCTPVYSACTSQPTLDADMRYYAYLLRHISKSGYINALARGVRERSTEFRFAELKEMKLPLPPSEDQHAIADFLDRETERIDALVAKERRLIELLHEERRALISSRVTKGTSPSIAMKDTGLEWLGQIPAHWGVMRLSWIVDPQRRVTYGIVQPGDPDPSGTLMVRGQDYSNGWAARDTIFRASLEIEAPYARARLAAGDLVMTIVGAGVGNTAIVPDWLAGANITQTTARIALNPRWALPNYAHYLMQSSVGSANVEMAVRGAAQPGLTLANVQAFILPLPPVPEQAALASGLDRDLASLDRLVGNARGVAEHLGEYRSSLITAAVTGQIDVREYARRQVDAGQTTRRSPFEAAIEESSAQLRRLPRWRPPRV